ncbi:MAG TPA: phosphatase PAP2 family protein [Novosphingobium sp.]|nr:phosphatase PAP2 family protein [Novosphingobium sp.]
MRRVALLAAGAAIAVLSACAATGRAEPPAAADHQDAATRASAFLSSGYVPRGSGPDSLLINPPPPAPGSPAEARDMAAADAAVAIQGSLRFEQAAIDADLFSPSTTGIFSCAAGFVISPETTPRIAALMRRTAADLALSVYPTKRKYQRPRPFMVNGKPTCTPQDEAMLRQDGSYPSGHAAIGVGWGLILASIVPDRAGQLAARGRAFADSRRVCNVHWLSDTEEGAVVAAAMVARLHAEPAFRADLDAARAEVEALRTSLPKPDCTKEQAALGG